MMSTTGIKALFLLGVGVALLSSVVASNYYGDGEPLFDTRRGINGDLPQPPFPESGGDHSDVMVSPISDYADAPIPDYADAPVPDYADAPYVEEPVPAEWRIRDEVAKCIEIITTRCGDEVYQYVFLDDDYPSPGCCEKLVSMGKPCHDRLIERVASMTPAFRKKITADPKNEQVWKYCLSKAGGISPSA